MHHFSHNEKRTNETPDGFSFIPAPPPEPLSSPDRDRRCLMNPHVKIHRFPAANDTGNRPGRGEGVFGPLGWSPGFFWKYEVSKFETFLQWGMFDLKMPASFPLPPSGVYPPPPRRQAFPMQPGYMRADTFEQMMLHVPHQHPVPGARPLPSKHRPFKHRPYFLTTIPTGLGND